MSLTLRIQKLARLGQGETETAEQDADVSMTTSLTTTMPAVDDDKQFGTHKTGDGIEVPDDSTFRIGRSDSADLRVAAPQVSSTHGHILKSGDEFQYHDTSRNGTTVNDERIKGSSVTLKHGDTIELPGDEKGPGLFVKVEITEG